MSGESAQQKAGGEQALWQAQLSQQLAGIAQPQLASIMGRLQGTLGSADATGRLAPDAAVRQSALSQLNQGYSQAGFGQREAIGYGGLRSGEARLGPGVMSSATMSAATNLDRDRQSALRNLEFMSAQSSLSDYNQVLQLLGQGTSQATSLAGGFSGAAGQAIGGLSNTSQFGGILGGAAAGASIGSIFPGWGTVIGGVVGGVAGGLANQ